ncbi:hypothetical protein ACIRBX_11270 [Kitasatospora sp. NPDC096147]|uniref:hypothetical protein n=1 Tax=Kitasatospora sp. NPDC096147 TaxID=3364093 RepID=UPI0038130A34
MVQPLLAALTEAGVPLRTGDLEQLRQAAVIGPDFARTLARWIRDAHAGAPSTPLPTAPVLRSIAPRPERPALERPALSGAAPALPDLQAS